MENLWWRVISKKKKNIFEFIIFLFLYILSIFYRTGLLVKKLLYKFNILRTEKLHKKIVLIGNITLGGTGKTTFTYEIGKRILNSEKKLLIVTKGYKREKINKIDVVSDGDNILLKVKNAGDEPFLLARNLKRAFIIASDDKVQGIKYGIERFHPDIILVDDGFQKRYRIKHAYNVLLIDCINPFGFNKLFPAGFLREPIKTIKDANIVILTNSNLVDSDILQRIKTVITKYISEDNIFEGEHQPKFFYNISTLQKIKLEHMVKKRVIAFCSVGNPLGFEKTLKKIGVHVMVSLRFRDHHFFRKKEMEAITNLYEKTNADYIITTEKDEVRINKKYIQNIPIYALKIGMLIKNIKNLEKKLKI